MRRDHALLACASLHLEGGPHCLAWRGVACGVCCVMPQAPAQAAGLRREVTCHCRPSAPGATRSTWCPAAAASASTKTARPACMDLHRRHQSCGGGPPCQCPCPHPLHVPVPAGPSQHRPWQRGHDGGAGAAAAGHRGRRCAGREGQLPVRPGKAPRLPGSHTWNRSGRGGECLAVCPCWGVTCPSWATASERWSGLQGVGCWSRNARGMCPLHLPQVRYA